MSIFNKVTKTFQWGQQTVTLETGEIARQSGGAVVVNIADTVILATVVARKDAIWARLTVAFGQNRPEPQPAVIPRAFRSSIHAAPKLSAATSEKTVPVAAGGT